MYFCLLLLCAPAAVGVAALQPLLAWRAAGGSASGRVLEPWLKRLTSYFAAVGVLMVVLEGTGGDFQHVFWTTLFAEVCLFTAAGPAASAFVSTRGRDVRRMWLVIATLVCLALLPIATTTLWTDTLPGLREPGTTGRKVIELAGLGLGGGVPNWLLPRTEIEMERGLAHLPRDVTVPLNTLLAGAWMIVVLCAALLAVRCCLPQRWRPLAAACVPPTAASVVASTPSGLHALGPFAFDAGWFRPFDALSSGTWDADPAVLRAFGPVLVAALASVAVLAVVSAFTRPEHPPDPCA